LTSFQILLIAIPDPLAGRFPFLPRTSLPSVPKTKPKPSSASSILTKTQAQSNRLLLSLSFAFPSTDLKHLLAAQSQPHFDISFSTPLFSNSK
jgi:hypothetical protein